MSNVAQLPALQQIDTRYTQDVIPILDTSKFEHMHRIAQALALGSTIPESLKKSGDTWLEKEVVVANCFRVVNQAIRWGFDPFAVMDCVSLVHGKMMYEGKLIAAVIDAKLGVKLAYSFSDHTSDDLTVTVSGTIPGEQEPRTLSGTVKQWHRGAKSPWVNPADWKRQLRYRGAREWCRAFTPALMLGIYTNDELQDIALLDVPAGQRALRIRDITPASKPLELPDIPDVPEIAPPIDDSQDGIIREIEKRVEAGTDPKLVEREFATVIMAMDEDGRSSALEMIHATAE